METLEMPQDRSNAAPSAEPREPHDDAGPSTSSSSPTASGSTADTAGDELFIRHRVRKTDTLAGLAVKYKATIADIKRANALDTDTAMYGRGVLLIPTRPLPIGPEFAAWAGMIEAHYGGRGAGHGTGQLRPGALGALTELRGFYSTGPSLAASPGGSDREDDDENENGFDFEALRLGVAARRREPANREVELMTRPGASATAGYIEDRLRRRKNGEEFDDAATAMPSTSGSGGSPSSGLPPRAPETMRQPLFRSSVDFRRIGGGGGGASAAGVTIQGGLQELKEWRRKGLQWREQMLNKLKRASQPAFIHAAASSGLAAAAAAAVTDVGNLGCSRSSTSGGAMDLQTAGSSSGCGGGGAASRYKDGGKAD